MRYSGNEAREAWGRTATREAIQTSGIFSALPDTDREALASHAIHRTLDSGQILFIEGEQVQGVYILASGLVRSVRQGSAGGEQVLSVERPVAMLGDAAIFDGGRYYTTAIAQQSSDVLFIAKDDFQRVCQLYPALFSQALTLLAARVREYADLIEALALQNVDRRVAWFLLRECTSRGIRTEGGTAFELVWTHQQIAAHLGTVREMVTRALGHLHKRDFVKVNGRLIVILNPSGLIEFASS